jgi:hypothetical protein
MAAQPFDWTQFLTLAQELAERPQEASLRSSVSRAYISFTTSPSLELPETASNLSGANLPIYSYGDSITTAPKGHVLLLDRSLNA